MKNKGKNVLSDFAQTFKELKNSSESKSNTNNSIDKKSIENINENDGSNEIRGNSIELKSIENKTIEISSIDQKNKEPRSSGIHPTSIRVVKEELLKALDGLTSSEIKIGDIAPLTGLTRRTVDRVCKHLGKTGEFTFERQHRGMKVTYLH